MTCDIIWGMVVLSPSHLFKYKISFDSMWGGSSVDLFWEEEEKTRETGGDAEKCSGSLLLRDPIAGQHCPRGVAALSPYFSILLLRLNTHTRAPFLATSKKSCKFFQWTPSAAIFVWTIPGMMFVFLVKRQRVSRHHLKWVWLFYTVRIVS